MWFLARNTPILQYPDIGKYLFRNRDEPFPCNPACLLENGRCRRLKSIEKSTEIVLIFHNLLKHYGMSLCNVLIS